MSKKNHSLKCPKCHSINVFGMTRVVGYYSIIENWNEGKQAEHADRQKGTYKLQENNDQCFDIEKNKIKAET